MMRVFGPYRPETTAMTRLAIPLVLFLILCLTVSPCGAADEAEATTAIRLASQQYLAALERGDRAGVAAFWTERGDLIDSCGHCTKGRVLAAQIPVGKLPGGAPKMSIDSLREVTPEVVIEDGRVQWPAVGDTEAQLVRYTAVWVRQGGKWLLDSVRESAADPNTHEARLQALSWLIGDWVSEEGGPAIEMSCQWSLDRHFLLREVRTKSPSGELSISQRIGWDPASGQIKSWTFDSEGGHGTGVWSRDGERWLVSATGVLPDGRPATTRNSYSLSDTGELVWESHESSIAGAPGPAHKVRLVRKNARSSDRQDSPRR